MDGRKGNPQRHVAALGWSAARGNYTYLGYGQDGIEPRNGLLRQLQKGLIPVVLDDHSAAGHRQG